MSQSPLILIQNFQNKNFVFHWFKSMAKWIFRFDTCRLLYTMKVGNLKSNIYKCRKEKRFIQIRLVIGYILLQKLIKISRICEYFNDLNVIWLILYFQFLNPYL